MQRRTGLPVLVTGGVLEPGAEPIAVEMARSLRDEFGIPVRWVEPAFARHLGECAYSAPPCCMRTTSARSISSPMPGTSGARHGVSSLRDQATIPAPLRFDRTPGFTFDDFAARHGDADQPITRCTNGSAMSTTRCADAISGVARSAIAAALPPPRGCSRRAADRFLCGRRLVATVLAGRHGGGCGAALRGVRRRQPAVLWPMQLSAAGGTFASLTTPLHWPSISRCAIPLPTKRRCAGHAPPSAVYCRAGRPCGWMRWTTMLPRLPALLNAGASTGLACWPTASTISATGTSASPGWTGRATWARGPAQLRETIRRKLARAGGKAAASSWSPAARPRTRHRRL